MFLWEHKFTLFISQLQTVFKLSRFHPQKGNAERKRWKNKTKNREKNEEKKNFKKTGENLLPEPHENEA